MGGGSTGSFSGHWLVVEPTLDSIMIIKFKTTIVDSLDIVFFFPVVFANYSVNVGTGTGRLIQRSL